MSSRHITCSTFGTATRPISCQPRDYRRHAQRQQGGGAVTAKVNGQKRALEIKLAKDAVNPEDIEMLQDLIVSAVKEAMRQAEEVAKLKWEK